MELSAEEMVKGILSDEEYMRRYSEIGEMYYLRWALMRELKSKGGESGAAQILELGVKIKVMESAFIKDVESGVGQGKRFSFEVLAEKFNLELSEKRILLFFLFLEFFHASENVCLEMDILDIMDLENSPIGRMRNFRYLRKSATLFRNRLLLKEVVKTGTCATFSVSLSGFALEVFSGLVNGERISERPGQLSIDEMCGEIGTLKDPEYTLEDVVLKESVRDKVMFFLSAQQEPAMEAFMGGRTIKKGIGLNFLLYGPPGTGKSMLAEAIAAYTGRKLLMVETPKIFSRWVGETDRAIARIFKVAKDNNLVICMDEADSLLYNRMYAGQEHDIRFVNIMLQEIERFEGVAIFTTNLESLLDPALERRISLRIQFEIPDEKMRSQIWKNHVPSAVKVAEDVDFHSLAQRFEFAGGYIKNAVLNALRKVALRKDDILAMDDLVWSGNLEKEGLFNKIRHRRSLGFTAFG